MCFEENDDQNGKTIWSCAISPSQCLKKVRPNSKLNHIIQLNCRERGGGCAPMQMVQQPVTLDNFDLSDELWLIISVALIILL